MTDLICSRSAECRAFTLANPTAQRDAPLKIALITIGALIGLGGLFLGLASQGIGPLNRVLSPLNLSGTLIGTTLTGVGILIVAAGIFHPCHQPHHSRTIHPVPLEPPRYSALLPYLSLSSGEKEAILSGKITTESLKATYERLSKRRKFPPLCGWHDTVPGHFVLFLPGIAAITALLRRKHALDNLWVCHDRATLQNKLLEIQAAPHDQKQAFIIPTHSSLNGISPPKTIAYEQHKCAVCVEKKQGHLHIYLMECMPPSWNCLDMERIHMKPGMPFMGVELALAYLDATLLDPAHTSLYMPVTAREVVSGCAVFALRDGFYFLRDPDFTQKLRIDTSGKYPPKILPKTKIPLHALSALPPECMQLTQSMKTIDAYQQAFAELATTPFGPKQKTLADSKQKHMVSDEISGRPQNHRVAHMVLKYQQILLNLLQQERDATICALINEVCL